MTDATYSSLIRPRVPPSAEVVQAFIQRFEGATAEQANYLLGWAFACRVVRGYDEDFGYVEEIIWPYVMQRRELYRLGEAPVYLGVEREKVRRRAERCQNARLTNEAYARVGKRFTADMMAFIREYAPPAQPPFSAPPAPRRVSTNYVSTVNGQEYSDPKYAPENLNFCVVATLISTHGNRERVIDRAHFPYRHGGDADAVAAAKRHVAESFLSRLDGNSTISLSSGALPADEFWPTR